MWPWSRPKLDPEQAARLERMERRLKEIELEWDGWYDKFRRLYARLAKRAKEQSSEDAPEPTITRQPISPLASRLLNPYGDGSGR